MINALTQFAASEPEVESGIGALGIDPKAFIIQLITFLFVFLVLRRYVFTPVVKALDKRQATIDKGVQLTSELTRQKEAFDKEVAEARKRARAEAEQIVNDSHSQATQMIREAEESAQVKAEQIVTDARKKIQDETARARRDLEKEMVELVIDATEAVTRTKLDSKQDNALVAAALKGKA